MKKLLLSLCLSLLTLCSFASAAVPTTNLAPMLEKTMPAVVNIRSQIKITDPNVLNRIQQEKKAQNDDSPIPDKIVTVASGVIIDANKGYILTNAHVIADAQTVMVTLSDGHHFTAKIIGLDKPTDIALLQIRAKNLTAIPFADSSLLKIGDPVIAIGNPFGLNQSVTSGIVSALGRAVLGIESFENFIQVDAPINPGNSGGALIDTQGKLIGINTAIIAPERGNVGIGLAIPSNMARSIMQQLIEYGDVKRGALGVGAQDITPEIASAFNLNSTNGAVITLVVKNSPAQKAGLQVGDIITTVNGSAIKNANDVVNAVGFSRVDSKLSMTAIRNNKTVTLTAKLTDPQKRQQEEAAQDPFLYGVGLKKFTQSSPIHGDVQGVLVVSLDENSNAWHSDVRPGDVIISANQQKVTTIDELRAIAAKASPQKGLLLNVLRGPGALFLVVTVEE